MLKISTNYQIKDGNPLGKLPLGVQGVEKIFILRSGQQFYQQEEKMKLKLAERTVNKDRWLIACIYDYIPSSGDNLYYCEMMRLVINKEKDKPYHNNTLKVGNRIYLIHNSAEDNLGPETEINNEELLEWEKEFANERWIDFANKYEAL